MQISGLSTIEQAGPDPVDLARRLDTLVTRRPAQPDAPHRFRIGADAQRSHRRVDIHPGSDFA